MAKRSKIAQAAYDVSKPLAEEMGFELVDAEYKKEGQYWFLRLYIDKKGGISIDDCEEFSRAVDPILDEKVEHDADYFEVSSPGLTRPLTTPEDYVRYQDELLEVSLFEKVDGVKDFTGHAKEISDEGVVFEFEDNKETKTMFLKYEQMSKTVRHIEF